MTIVVENGTNVPGANSYASEAALAAYASARGVSIAGNVAEILIKAMDALEYRNFIGSKANFDQPLQWPRLGVQIDGYTIASNTIPADLISSQIELALAIDGGTNPLANQPRETISEKIAGVIEVEYSTSARSTTYLAAAEAKLSRLVRHGVRIVRV